MLRKILYYIIHDPKRLLIILLSKIGRVFPDEIYLKIQFKLNLGYDLDLKSPKSYNEKLQWLKLYDRKPQYTEMVDKYAAKSYVASIIGDEYIIPTLGVWERFEDIDFDSLPDQFVLKCTHDSGGVIICKDKRNFNHDAAAKKIKKLLRRRYYWLHREYPYKAIQPRIIAEKYMEDESGYELKDYKWFCFNGKPKIMFIACDRSTEDEETKFDFFDSEFNHLPFTNGHPNSLKPIYKPDNFELMKELASKLSKGIPHLRVDFYNINGKIYFGELTFYHWSGLVPFEPQEWDYILGSWITLP